MVLLTQPWAPLRASLSRALLVIPALLAPLACGSGAQQRPSSAVAPRSNASPPPAIDGESATTRAATELAPASPRSGAGATSELPEQASLELVQRVALARNPELSEARKRVRAARAAVSASSRLPDPEFEYVLWSAPLARPYALDEAEMHMFGLRQSFPAPGSLAARGEAAEERVALLTASEHGRALDLLLRVRRAYAEYFRAHSEYRIHVEHARIAEQVIELARAGYRAGRGTQRDLVRSVTEMARLHRGVAMVRAEVDSARALLNTLMARPLEAPLGAPVEMKQGDPLARFQDLERRMLAQRPELGAAETSIRLRERELDEARATANYPSFMVGLQYMYAPTAEPSADEHAPAPMGEPHNYGVMFSMSLPWLYSGNREQVRAAEASLSAEHDALASARLAAKYELYAAFQRLRAARESLAILESDLAPRAQQSLDIAQAAYQSGQGDLVTILDALTSLLDVKLERQRALTSLTLATAELERAVGTPLATKSSERTLR